MRLNKNKKMNKKNFKQDKTMMKYFPRMKLLPSLLQGQEDYLEECL